MHELGRGRDSVSLEVTSRGMGRPFTYSVQFVAPCLVRYYMPGVRSWALNKKHIAPFRFLPKLQCHCSVPITWAHMKRKACGTRSISCNLSALSQGLQFSEVQALVMPLRSALIAVHGRRVCPDVDDCHSLQAGLVPLPLVVLCPSPDGLQAHQDPCPAAHLARPPSPLRRSAVPTI